MVAVLPVRAQNSLEPRVTLRLREATAAEVAAALTAALGAAVTVDGPAAQRVSLELEEATGAQALDRAAAALGGRWQTIYLVEPATAGGRRGSGARGVATGHTVTLRLEGVAAGAALAAVARAAGAQLEWVGPPAGSVTLDAVNLPVEEALDRVTEQFGARWSARYRLIPGSNAAPAGAVLPQTPEATPRAPTAGLVPLTPPAGWPPARGSAARQAPETAALRQMLTNELARLLQTEPGARSPAVRRYTARLEHLLNGLVALPPAEQARRMEPLRRLFRSGLRAFGGLTPDQQSDFRPVIEVFRRWTR